MLYLLSVTVILKPKICFCFVGCCCCFLAFFFLFFFLKQTNKQVYYCIIQVPHNLYIKEIYSSLLHLDRKKKTNEWQSVMNCITIQRSRFIYTYFLVSVLIPKIQIGVSWESPKYLETLAHQIQIKSRFKQINRLTQHLCWKSQTKLLLFPTYFVNQTQNSLSWHSCCSITQQKLNVRLCHLYPHL